MVLRILGQLATFAVAIEAARRIAIAKGVVSHPTPMVRAHRTPVARLGGTGFFTAYLAWLSFPWISGGARPDADAVARTAGALAFAAIGTWDDLRPLTPRQKFLAQLAVCAGFLVAIGAHSALGFAWKLLLLLTLVNAYNLIDVMDGLLCVLGAVAVSTFLFTPGLVPASAHPELALLLVGIATLFLFNRPQARVFAGDAGSLPIGFLVGAFALSAEARADGHLSRLAILGAFAVPALELAILIPARLMRGRSPFYPSTDHFSMRLHDRLGWNRWRILGATAVAGALFATAPGAGGRLSETAFGAYLSAAVVLGALLWWAVWRVAPVEEGTG